MESRPSLARSLLRPRYLVIAVLTLALIIAARRLGAGPMVGSALDWIKGLGPLAPLAFILIYVVACVMFVPGSLLTIGAGVIFGLFWGAIYVSTGATLGATAAFLIGRYVARGWVARRLEGNSKFRAIDEAVAREGWKIVGLTRLSPVFPFNLLNYAFGLTKIRLADYFFASWVGMIPGTVMYVYVGSLSGDLARAASEGSAGSPARWALNLIGFAATVAVAVYVTRIGARALRERTS